MRTTLAFEPDVAVEIERLKRQSGQGVSAIVNDLIRRGLSAPASTVNFEQDVSAMGQRIDVSNVAEVIELLEGPTHR